jgi:hypothetical protein
MRDAKAAPPPEELAYDIATSCLKDKLCRSTKYRAISPDPEKRDGLPFLPSFTVGRRRLILESDHRAWLEQLRAASLSANSTNAAGADASERA